MAQTANLQQSYITPFPKGDRYRIVVLGDSLGDGLWTGLYRSFQDEKDVDVVRRAKISTGLVRTDIYNWNKQLKEILKKDGKYQIAVVMFGANDDQPIHDHGNWYATGSPGWRDAYAKRVGDFIKTLKAAGIATYWVGLPVMRSAKMNQDAEMMNDIFREESFIYQTKFIDTWSGFTNESGHYSAYGPDMTGEIRRLRAEDGVHFTPRGYLKLAHFVGKEIRRDLSLAKQQRNIPLAGTPAEQAKIVPHPKSASDQGRGSHAIQAQGSGNSDTGAKSTSGDQHGAALKTPKLEQTTVVAGVKLLRPVISARTLQATQSLAPQGAAMSEGVTVGSNLGNGLTALSSISAVSDVSAVSSKQRLPLAERPYYRVLVKGEALKPKVGRADDFRWPLQ